MNNDIKMKIKSVPGLSSAAMLVGRTVVRRLRMARALPAMRRENERLLETLAMLQPGVPRIWYFGAPIHSNLGDQAQKAAILAWLAREFPDHEVIMISTRAFNGNPQKAIGAVSRILGPTDILIMQSGHTMSGVHPDEIAHRLVARAFMANRLVFFPTSISFLNRSGMRKDIHALEGRPRTLLLARDPMSFETARRIYPDIDVELYPDIVATLIGEYRFEDQRQGTLLCLRNDGERICSTEEAEALATALAELGSVSRFDTTVNRKIGDLPLKDLQREIDAVIGDFARYRAVVTDRYHGVIFARIANTPVVALKTIDHKVLSGAQWFIDAGDEGVAIAEKPGQAAGLAAQLMTQFPNGVAAPRFAAGPYSRLKDLIEGM